MITPGRLLAVSFALLVAACAGRDPYQRTDVWRPTGANDGNIAAMVANPHDLITGRGVRTVDTKATTAAIEHVWAGDPKPLAYGSTTSGAAASPGPSQPGSPAPGGQGSGSTTPSGN